MPNHDEEISRAQTLSKKMFSYTQTNNSWRARPSQGKVQEIKEKFKLRHGNLQLSRIPSRGREVTIIGKPSEAEQITKSQDERVDFSSATQLGAGDQISRDRLAQSFKRDSGNTLRAIKELIFEELYRRFGEIRTVELECVAGGKPIPVKELLTKVQELQKIITSPFTDIPSLSLFSQSGELRSFCSKEKDVTPADVMKIQRGWVHSFSRKSDSERLLEELQAWLKQKEESLTVQMQSAPSPSMPK